MTDDDAVVFKAWRPQLRLIVDALRGHAATLLARSEEEDFVSVKKSLVHKALEMHKLAEDLKKKMETPDE